jgi:hypothetical protein
LFTGVVFLSLGKIKVEPREAIIYGSSGFDYRTVTYFQRIHPPITHISLYPSHSESFVRLLVVLLVFLSVDKINVELGEAMIYGSFGFGYRWTITHFQLIHPPVTHISLDPSH